MDTYDIIANQPVVIDNVSSFFIMTTCNLSSIYLLGLC